MINSLGKNLEDKVLRILFLDGKRENICWHIIIKDLDT